MSKKSLLFNPTLVDENVLIGGDSSNILDLSKNTKYTKYVKLFIKAYGNNWIPEKVSNMDVDKLCYANVLSDEEREAFDLFTSFLIFLDSLQVNNLPNISDFVTSPEVKLYLTRQTYEEGVHSYSYSFIGKNIMSIERFHNLIYLWRDNKLLLDRISYIASLYEEYKDKDDDMSFFILAIANYLLEGVYFYNGFMFFHNLSSRGLMIASNTQISYIKRDELIHCEAFRNIILDFKEEHPDKFDSELIYDMFREAVKREIDFMDNAIGNKILGMSKETTIDYTYYIANLRLSNLGLDKIFPKKKNPYKHLERLAAIDDETTNRANNFTTTSIAYKAPEAIFDDWNEDW